MNNTIVIFLQSDCKKFNFLASAVFSHPRNLFVQRICTNKQKGKN